MLQQTQVERVVPLYKKFIKKFPTSARLASSSLASVLQTWQGLGYNRRAKQLQTAAKKLLTSNPRTPEELQKLPGVGPYTARAVAAFAFNKNVVFIETNIRTVIIHHFFSTAKERKSMIYHTSDHKISDKEIEAILAKVLPKGRAREWYSALLDYGAYLKHSGISHNARGKAYAKQSKFAGSLRQARGAVLRALVRGTASPAYLAHLLGAPRRAQMREALRALSAEGLIEERRGRFSLANQ